MRDALDDREVVVDGGAFASDSGWYASDGSEILIDGGADADESREIAIHDVERSVVGGEITIGASGRGRSAAKIAAAG